MRQNLFKQALKANGFKYALKWSISLHVILLVVLSLNLNIFSQPTAETVKSREGNNNKALQAISVNQDEVLTLVKNRKAIKRNQKLAMQQAAAEQKKLQSKLRRERKRLKAIEQKKRRIAVENKKKLRQAKKDLAKLQAQKKAELTKKKQLAKSNRLLKAKQKKEAEALQKLKAEQKKLAEKKRAELAAKKANELSKGQLDKISLYTQKIYSALSSNWLLPSERFDKSLECKLKIELGKDGVVKSVTLIKSSGDDLFDRSALSTVHKSSPLAVPKEERLFREFRVIYLTLRPESLANQG